MRKGAQAVMGQSTRTLGAMGHPKHRAALQRNQECLNRRNHPGFCVTVPGYRELCLAMVSIQQLLWLTQCQRAFGLVTNDTCRNEFSQIGIVLKYLPNNPLRKRTIFETLSDSNPPCLNPQLTMRSTTLVSLLVSSACLVAAAPKPDGILKGEAVYNVADEDMAGIILV